MGKIYVAIFFLALIPGILAGIADDNSVKFGNVEGGDGGIAIVEMPEKVESKVDMNGQLDVSGTHMVGIGHDGRVVHIHQGGSPPVFGSGSQLSTVSCKVAIIRKAHCAKSIFQVQKFNL